MTRWVGRDARDGHIAFEIERDRRRPRSWKLWRAAGLSQNPGGDGCYETGRYASAEDAMADADRLMFRTTIRWTSS